MDPAFVCICPGCPEVPVPQKWRREPCLVSAAERGEDGIFCWLRSQSAAIYQTVFSLTSLQLGTPHFSFQEQHATTGRELPSQTAKIQRGVNDYWGSTSAQTTMKGLATAPNTWAWVQLRPKKTQTGDGLGGVTCGKNGQGIPNQLLQLKCLEAKLSARCCRLAIHPDILNIFEYICLTLFCNMFCNLFLHMLSFNVVFVASLRISWRVQYDGYVVGKFENEEAQRVIGILATETNHYLSRTPRFSSRLCVVCHFFDCKACAKITP